MVPYLAKRIGRSILTLFIIVTLVFCLLRLMPVEGYFANYEKMTEAQIQAGLQSMGLLDPLPVQIGHFWRDALHSCPKAAHFHRNGCAGHAAQPTLRHPTGPAHGPVQGPLAG